LAGDAYDDGVVGDIVGDDTVGTDGGVITYDDLAKYFCTGTDVDIIAYYRHTRAVSPPADTDGDVMGEVAVLADDHILVGDDAAVMTDVEPGSDLGFIRNSNAIFILEMIVPEPSEGEKDAPDLVRFEIGAEAHPNSVAVARGEKAVIGVSAETGFAGVAEEVGAKQV